MLPRNNTLIVEGYRELNRAFRMADDQLVAGGLRAELRELGEVVRRDAAARMTPYDVRSAAGFRTQTQVASMYVAQTRRSKHVRPQFGALQMTKALLPALDAHRQEIELGFERVLDHIIWTNFGL